MNYVLLVSHGDFAVGLHQALSMFVGEREDVYSIGLGKNEDVASLAERIKELFKAFKSDDQFLILADLIGGSPLTTLLNCMEEAGYLAQTKILGGMNLAMALTAVLRKEDLQNAMEMALKEGIEAMKEFEVVTQDEDDI